jgi:hypothetical protein
MLARVILVPQYVGVAAEGLLPVGALDVSQVLGSILSDWSAAEIVHLHSTGLLRWCVPVILS